MRKGFTLIELMIVMAVIAIIIGIAIPRFKGMKDDANITKAMGELRTLQTAIEAYYKNQNPNAYPDSGANVCADYLNTASPVIVNDVLTDPFRAGSNEYRYYLSANGFNYVIFSYGPDGGADITGISDAGVLAGANDDDIYATNGTGF